MTLPPTEPAAIEWVGSELAIRWRDGHESFYTPERLREHCPCANCKVRRQKMERDPFPMFAPAALASPGVLATEPVGRYALRFHWTDRHDSGIYDFRMLRDLCACTGCQPGRTGASTTPPAESSKT